MTAQTNAQPTTSTVMPGPAGAPSPDAPAAGTSSPDAPSTDAPATMRAVTRDRYGSAAVLSVSEVDRPTIGAGQVLVEVAAAGVDRGAWHLITGTPLLIRLMGFGLLRPKQPVPGAEVAGRVVQVAADVTRLQPGDRVFGVATGAWAQYAVAEADKLAVTPDGVSDLDAAVAPISGATALEALTDVGQVRAGQSVLVLGASGGVGTWAVQLAKSLGATVTGVASTAKLDLVRSLGADHVVDYTTTDALDTDERYDLVVDIGGRNPVLRLRRVLTATGTLVVVGGEGGGRITGGFGRGMRAVALSAFVSQRLTMFVSSEHHSIIERVGAFLASGDAVPAISATVDLAGVPDAIRDLEAGRVAGKVAVAVDPPTT